MQVVIAAFVQRHETAAGVFMVTGSETSRVGMCRRCAGLEFKAFKAR